MRVPTCPFNLQAKVIHPITRLGGDGFRSGRFVNASHARVSFVRKQTKSPHGCSHVWAFTALRSPVAAFGPVGEVERRIHNTPEAHSDAIDNLRGTPWLWLAPFRQGNVDGGKAGDGKPKRAPPFAHAQPIPFCVCHLSRQGRKSGNYCLRNLIAGRLFAQEEFT